jgi:hypothetical protein
VSDAKHTPGVWTAEEPRGRGDDKQVIITAPGVGSMRKCVAITCRRARIDEQELVETDARLIAAAPELLAVCQKILAILNHPTNHVTMIEQMELEKVIAKATNTPSP